jgi:hypothetical protein
VAGSALGLEPGLRVLSLESTEEKEKHKVKKQDEEEVEEM